MLFVGRLQPRKRVDLLLKACAAVRPQPDLWIVGDGPDRIRLEQVAENHYPAARFFGALRGADLDERFATADLFVLPGTGGLAVQQAIANGLPVIVAEADGSQAELVSSHNGWQIVPGDQDDLTRALQSAFEDPEALIEKAKNSYQISTEQANIDIMATAFIEALNRVGAA